MSRSRRKTPITGVTAADSEKSNKRFYSRRIRRASKQKLGNEPEQELMPILQEFSDPWLMDKDGKTRFDPTSYPELMRK